jgi:hypothetical protein
MVGVFGNDEKMRSAPAPDAETRRSVVFIHPEGNHLNNPTLYEMARLLVGRGVPVDFFPGDRRYGKGKWTLVDRFAKNLFLFVLPFSPVLAELVVLFMYRDSLAHIKHSRLMLGVDREGIILAGVLARKYAKPLGLVSFEIMFEDETSKRFKAAEIAACKTLRLWFIQDELRARLLAAENRLESRPVILPVGNSSSIETADKRLRDALGVPKNMRVAIVIGSTESWTFSRQFVESFCKAAGNDWCLIVHSRYGQVPDWSKALSASTSGRVYWSTQPRDFDSMGEVLAGVDVGIALYNPQPSNRYEGKI